MNTKLYKIIHQKVLESGMSMRAFARTYNISRPWLISFLSPKDNFREVSPRTISLLYMGLGIDPSICDEYNKWVRALRGE